MNNVNDTIIATTNRTNGKCIDTESYYAEVSAVSKLYLALQLVTLSQIHKETKNNIERI